MPRIIIVRIPDPEEGQIPEQRDELSNTLVRFFGDNAIGAQVHQPNNQLEEEIEERIQEGSTYHQTERSF